MVRLLLFLVFSVMPLLLSAQFPISASKYDYAPIAQQITDGEVTKYDKARSIYQWICKTSVMIQRHYCPVKVDK